MGHRSPGSPPRCVTGLPLRGPHSVLHGGPHAGGECSPCSSPVTRAGPASAMEQGVRGDSQLGPGAPPPRGAAPLTFMGVREPDLRGAGVGSAEGRLWGGCGGAAGVAGPPRAQAAAQEAPHEGRGGRVPHQATAGCGGRGQSQGGLPVTTPLPRSHVRAHACALPSLRASLAHACPIRDQTRVHAHPSCPSCTRACEAQGAPVTYPVRTPTAHTCAGTWQALHMRVLPMLRIHWQL